MNFALPMKQNSKNVSVILQCDLVSDVTVQIVHNRCMFLTTKLGTG